MTGRSGRGAGLLEGRVAVVTGAGRGIGYSIAHRFVAEGATVVIAEADEETGRRAADELGPSTSFVPMDVSQEASVESGTEQIFASFPTVDCFVANAGILALSPALETPLATWQRVIDVNLTGAFLTCKAFAARMVKTGHPGRIIVTSSLFGLRGGAENSAYSASKFGVIGLVQCLAAELAPHRITVNAVCPGQIETEMIRSLFRERSALLGISESEVRDRLLAKVPAGRLGTADEVADAFVFLASELSSYVTGESLVVDGGFRVS